jgi:hypothetical protein
MLDAPADRLARQCRIVEACETLSAAARAEAELAHESERLDLWRLPLVAESAAVAALAQAEACEAWALQADPDDALLARDLRRLAEGMRDVARQATHMGVAATEFVAAEADEAHEAAPEAA